MSCNQTKNFTDPDNDFMYVERRRVCSCGYRMMTVEISQDVFTKKLNMARKEAYESE
jgi:hypothetical protein